MVSTRSSASAFQELLATYGERLLRVRYRYDAARGVRHKTVELIVETIKWNSHRRNPRREPQDMVAVTSRPEIHP